jgi:hypothetical protein
LPGTVGVGEVDVVELVLQGLLRLHKIYPARADVAGIEGDVTEA